MKRRHQAKFRLRESHISLAEPLCEVLLFFFLSLSECFHLPSPFAVCAVCAYIFARRRLLFPIIGLALSLSLRLLWGVSADVWQYIACAILLLLKFRPPQSLLTASAASAAALSLRIIALILAPQTPQAMILATVSMTTGALCTPAICHAVTLYKRARTRMRIDDVLCCLVLCAVMLSGAGRVALGPINIGFTLCGTAVLLSACIGGCTAAVCAGLISGVSLSLCGHADAYVVCYAFSGIVTGLFYGKKRLPLCLLYLTCCVFTSYAVRFSLDLPFIGSAALSCALFLVLPKRSISTAFALTRSLSPDASDNEAAYAQSMRRQWTHNIARLSQLLPEVRLSEPDEDEQLEDMIDHLCTGCAHLPQCWHDQAEESQALFKRYFITGDHTVIMPDCPRADAWPALALEQERSKQQHALRMTYAQREREGTRTHLSAIAEAMANLSHEGGRCDRDDETLWGEAAYLLRSLRLPAKLLYALRINQHVCVALRYEPQLTRYRQLERYCEALSSALNLPLYITQHSKDMIVYEEAPPLFCECFHLSISASDGDGINGDAALSRAASGGMEICILSDGMGHGSQAHEESEKTLELISLCIDSGYSIDAALSAINAIMLSSTDGEQYATVDLCAANLWDKTVTLHKLGACPSILVSGGSIRILESSALPLGIVPGVKSATHRFSIDEGDVLIQFTDGLSDACGGLHAVKQQVALLQHDRQLHSPQFICDALLSAALRRSGGAPKDDITVLCSIFKKRAEKKRENTSPA